MSGAAVLHGDDPEQPSRLAPIPREDWTQEMRDFFAISEGEQCRTEGTRFNIQAVMANHLPLCTAWCTYNKFIARDLELPDVLREVAILRIAWNLRAGYEYHQHRAIGRRCGLSEEKLAAIPVGEAAAIWSDDERLMIRAADEMHRNNAASAETMAALFERFGTKQTMEILWTIGTYGALGWIANSLAVPIEHFMRD